MRTTQASTLLVRICQDTDFGRIWTLSLYRGIHRKRRVHQTRQDRVPRRERLPRLAKFRVMLVKQVRRFWVRRENQWTYN